MEAWEPRKRAAAGTTGSRFATLPPALALVPFASADTEKYQYQGKVREVNNGTNTITVQGKKDKTHTIILTMTPQTRIFKNGKLATRQDLKIGEDVMGVCEITANKKMIANSAMLGHQAAVGV